MCLSQPGDVGRAVFWGCPAGIFGWGLAGVLWDCCTCGRVASICAVHCWVYICWVWQQGSMLAVLGLSVVGLAMCEMVLGVLRRPWLPVLSKQAVLGVTWQV